MIDSPLIQGRCSITDATRASYIAALKRAATETLVARMMEDEEIAHLEREIVETRRNGGEWAVPCCNLAEITSRREWLGEMRGGWVDCRRKVTMPQAGGRSAASSTMPGEVFRFSFGVRFDKEPDGYRQTYALLKESTSEYDFGQEITWKPPVPEPVIEAHTAEELTEKTVMLAQRYFKTGLLLQSLARPDFGSEKWREDFNFLFEGEDAPYARAEEKIELRAAAAREAGIMETVGGDSALRLKPEMAGTIVREFPGDPGTFHPSPLFLQTDEPPSPRVVVAADGNRYRLIDSLMLGELAATTKPGPAIPTGVQPTIHCEPSL